MVYFIGGVLLMAAMTYLPRALPLCLSRGTIRRQSVQTVLYYLPYTALGAMTFPAILDSTADGRSAVVGLLVALFLAFFGQKLLTVAAGATGAVLLAEWVLRLTGQMP